MTRRGFLAAAAGAVAGLCVRPARALARAARSGWNFVAEVGVWNKVPCRVHTTPMGVTYHRGLLEAAKPGEGG